MVAFEGCAPSTLRFTRGFCVRETVTQSFFCFVSSKRCAAAVADRPDARPSRRHLSPPRHPKGLLHHPLQLLARVHLPERRGCAAWDGMAGTGRGRWSSGAPRCPPRRVSLVTLRCARASQTHARPSFDVMFVSDAVGSGEPRASQRRCFVVSEDHHHSHPIPWLPRKPRRSLMYHLLSFDFSAWEFYGCMLDGGTLVLMPKSEVCPMYSSSRRRGPPGVHSHLHLHL